MFCQLAHLLYVASSWNLLVTSLPLHYDRKHYPSQVQYVRLFSQPFLKEFRCHDSRSIWTLKKILNLLHQQNHSHRQHAKQSNVFLDHLPSSMYSPNYLATIFWIHLLQISTSRRKIQNYSSKNYAIFYIA